MESFKAPTIEKLRPEPVKQNSESLVEGITTQDTDEFTGFLEVFVHEAHDIQNICIYHKQDVYAKLCLTSDPEVTVSTQIINGGGRNPIFNETVRLHVRTLSSSLKCEIWMLSRVRNYLEDQLLGFALVPLSDVIMANSKLVQEFSLSSTDLFHSPAGFVQLSISYIGSLPDVMAIPSPLKSVILDSEDDGSIPCELDKIEFPDLKTVKENQMMLSEYLGSPCAHLECPNIESLIDSENGNCSDDDAGVRMVESFASSENSLDSALKHDTPQSCVSINGSPSMLPAPSQSSSHPSGITFSPSQKDKVAEGAEGEADSSVAMYNINIEPEQTIVEQDIVDMYMKSMNQFTETLAKMKLPMHIETNSDSTENAVPGPEQKLQAAKGTGSKVFYGSRAFF